MTMPSGYPEHPPSLRPRKTTASSPVVWCAICDTAWPCTPTPVVEVVKPTKSPVDRTHRKVTREQGDRFNETRPVDVCAVDGDIWPCTSARFANLGDNGNPPKPTEAA